MIRLNNIIRKIYNKYFHPDPLGPLLKKGLVVGKNISCMSTVMIDWSHCWHITIGDDVTLGPRVHILAHDASTKRYLNYTKIGKVKIGNRVFVGASSIILPGVTIGNDVIIGAGSIVTRDIPDGVVAAGNPAKVIGSIEEFISRRKKEVEIYPCFSDEYTEIKNVTRDMKNEMNQKMKDRYCYLR